MSQQSDLMYVAPAEAPPSRRPPLSQRGAVRWLRDNLFASVGDTIITIVTVLVIGGFLLVFLRWAFLQAQWELVFNNLRQLSVGNLYPVDETWRPEIAGYIFIFLALLSVGLWGRITRSVVITVAVIAAAMIVIPITTNIVPEPPVFSYVSESFPPREISFIAEAGQTLTFTIEPLTDPNSFRLSAISGYVENDNTTPLTSFDAFNTRTQGVTRFQIEASGQTAPPTLTEAPVDPSQYNLSLEIEILDSQNTLIAESGATDGSATPYSFAWTAPASGWYTYTVQVVGGSIGAAWLKVENLEVFRSTRTAQAERAAQYGAAPVLDCPGCATAANRTDMRFQGERTLPQWFSLQLTPFLLETRQIFFISVLVGAAGYALGWWSQRGGLGATLSSISSLLGRLFAAALGVYLLMQFAAQTLTSLPAGLLGFGLLAFGVSAYLLYAIGNLGEAKRDAALRRWATIAALLIFIFLQVILLIAPNDTVAWISFGALCVVIVGYAGFGLIDAAANAPADRVVSLILLASTLIFGALVAGAEMFRDGAVLFWMFWGLNALLLFYALAALLDGKNTGRAIALLWLVAVTVMGVLIVGTPQIQPLEPVAGQDLGGVLLTLMLSGVAILASIPLGVLLALGRQSNLPVISFICTVFIEVVRGVPLITLLFMGWLILPFFGLGLQNVDLVVRVMVVLTLFTSAYMAEVVRGGLQVIPKGQIEAAQAVGLNDFNTTALIILPQALRAVIPAIMGQAVSLFKDTSLIYVISLFELLGTMNQILGDSQTGYLLFPREGYLFIGAIYFVISYIMAGISRRIERTGAGAVRRETL